MWVFKVVLMSFGLNTYHTTLLPLSAAEKQVTSIKVDPELWKKVKIRCIERNISVEDFLDAALRDELKRA
jgi:hypothetical protein